MKNTVRLILLVLIANAYESTANERKRYPGVYKFLDLLKHEENDLRPLLLGDGVEQKLPAFEQMCYNAHQICKVVLKEQRLVCAQHDKYGLIDFPNICELRFQNCLTKSFEDRTGNKSISGLFYYNAEGKGCQHYVHKSLSLTEAIENYFMDDLEYKVKSYEEELANNA